MTSLLGVFVCPVVVQGEMDRRVGRCRSIDLFEKTQKLLMSMARLALTDDLAGRYIQRRKQRSGAVPFVIVSVPAPAVLAEGGESAECDPALEFGSTRLCSERWRFAFEQQPARLLQHGHAALARYAARFPRSDFVQRLVHFRHECKTQGDTNRQVSERRGAPRGFS